MARSGSKPSVQYRPIPGFEGYRLGDNGTLQSCWKSTGQGRGKPWLWFMSEEWHERKPDECKGLARFRLRNQSGEYQHKYLHLLMEEVFGSLVKPRK